MTDPLHVNTPEQDALNAELRARRTVTPTPYRVDSDVDGWVPAVREDFTEPFNRQPAVFATTDEAHAFIATMRGAMHMGGTDVHFRIVNVATDEVISDDTPPPPPDAITVTIQTLLAHPAFTRLHDPEIKAVLADVFRVMNATNWRNGEMATTIVLAAAVRSLTDTLSNALPLAGKWY